MNDNYVGIWVNVSFDKGNDLLSYDEDNAGSWTGNENLPFEEIFKDCYKGKHYFEEAAEIARTIGIAKINYVWLLFHEPESNASDPKLISATEETMPGVNVTMSGQAAYIGHFQVA